MEEFRELFILFREYLQKQREHITMSAAESMTRLLFAATMGLILMLLGSTVLLLTSFALAFWINETTGSTFMGFGILACAVLLLLTLFWFKRKQWVLQPIAKLMVQIFLEAEEENATNNTTTK